MTISPSDIERIDRAMQRAGETPVSELMSFDAEEILQRRLGYLTLYTGDDLPPDIAKRYEQVINLTRQAHKLAGYSISVFEGSASLKPFDRPYLYALAIARLDKQDEQRPATNEMQRTAKDHVRAVRRKVLAAIVQWLSGPPGQSLSAAITEAFAGEDQLDQTTASMQAAFIHLTSEQIEAQSTTVFAEGLISIYWRFLLYRVLLDDLGQHLEGTAYEEASKKTLAALSKKLIGMVLPLAGMVDTAQKIFEAARDLGDKERALRKARNELAKQNSLAKDYVDLYASALVAWVTQVSEMNRSFLTHVNETLSEYSVLIDHVSSTYIDLLPPAE